MTNTAMNEQREEAHKNALLKLRFETILSLESVIAGTPTGPTRDKLTEANIILHTILNPKEKA